MTPGAHTLTIPADVRELETLRQFFTETARRLGADGEATEDLLMALNEAATNVIVHGYAGRPGTVELLVRPAGADLELRLRDRAPLFDPTTVPPPRTDLPLALRRPGGMGVHLARHYTDELRYCVTAEGGNELILVKRRALPAAPEENERGTHG